MPYVPPKPAIKSKDELICEGASCKDGNGVIYSCETDSQCIALSLVSAKSRLGSALLSKRSVIVVSLTVSVACILVTLILVFVVRHFRKTTYKTGSPSETKKLHVEELSHTLEVINYATPLDDHSSANSSFLS